MPTPVLVYVIHGDGDAEAESARTLKMFLAQPLRLQRLRLAGRFEPGRVGVEADRFESECIASAPIIVLLVSARCLADRAAAIQQAVVQSRMQRSILIPVHVGAASVRDAVFSDLVPLPSIEPGVIARFRDRDDAWVNVAEGILDVVRDLPAIQERAQAARERPVPETGLRVLFAAANPTGTARLNVGTELAAVRGRLGREGLDEGVTFFDERAVDLAELASALNRTRPQVVHFVGHSKHEGSIVLDGLAEPQAVSDEALRQLFLPLPQRPKLLLLNTCFAGQQGSVLESVVECFIGHLDPIDDLGAVLFAEILYDGLLRGRSIRAAYDQAQAATHDRTRSVLRARDGIDPSKVTLVPYDPPSKS